MLPQVVPVLSSSVNLFTWPEAVEAVERRPSSRSESRSLCNTVILGLLTSSPADNSFPYGVLQQIPNSLVDQMMNQL